MRLVQEKVLYLAAAILASALVLGGVVPAKAQGSLSMKAAISNVGFDGRDGAVTFTAKGDTYELDYEAGTETCAKAKTYLDKVAAQGKEVSFTYFIDHYQGREIRVVTKSSVSAFAYPPGN